jgi:predicted nucleotide-binding protein
MQAGIDRLRKRIEEVKQFAPQSVTEQYNIPEIDGLAAAIDDALIRTFGANTTDYTLYKDAVTFDNGPHNYAYPVPIHEVQQSLSRSKARSITLLERAVRSLEERRSEEGGEAASMAAEVAPTLDRSKVFVVHGHDGAPKAEVARYIEKLGFEAIILHERPNKGRALITKFREEAAGVGFAVVLITPDDLGKAKEAGDLKPRARQNVVFELGFFVGKLGPERVAALVRGDVELPSDYDGVVYVSLDNEQWQTKLGVELQAAGFEFDWNKVMWR